MTTNELTNLVGDLDFSVEKSMRYHQRMRAHYDFYHKFLLFLAILGGSAAFAEITAMSNYFAAATTVFVAASLVFGLAQRTRDHEFLFRRFSDLAISIRTAKEPTEDVYKGWIETRLDIEASEPPVYWALEADCDNEVRRAWGKDKKLIPIGLWYRITMNWLRHAEKAFEPVPQK